MPAPGDAVAVAGVAAQLDHVALGAHRIRDHLTIYQGLLGGAFVGGGDNVRVGYRGVQFAYPGGAKVEILEPLARSTFLDRFLARGGGVHHVTFRVEAIEDAMDELVGRGFTPVAAHLDDLDWREVFLHPREAGGVLVQLAEAGPGYADRIAGVTLEDVLAGRGTDGNGVPSP